MPRHPPHALHSLSHTPPTPPTPQTQNQKASEGQTRLAMHTHTQNNQTTKQTDKPQRNQHTPANQPAHANKQNKHNKQTTPLPREELSDARVHYPDLKQQPHTRHHTPTHAPTSRVPKPNRTRPNNSSSRLILQNPNSVFADHFNWLASTSSKQHQPPPHRQRRHSADTR
jgi:hypothetical protein